MKKAFNALTPGRQRGYLLHFSHSLSCRTRVELLQVIFGTAGVRTSDIAWVARSNKPKDDDRDDLVVRTGQVIMHLGIIEQDMFQYYFPADGEEGPRMARGSIPSGLQRTYS